MIEKEEEEGLEWKAGGGREEGTKGYQDQLCFWYSLMLRSLWYIYRFADSKVLFDRSLLLPGERNSLEVEPYFASLGLLRTDFDRSLFFSKMRDL